MSPLLLAILAGSALAATTPKRQDAPSLNALFTNAGKQYFGAIADQGTLQDEQNKAVIQANFGQLTHENSLKWESVEPEEGSFNFDGPDQLMSFAGDNDIMVRGHTLVWHSQLPAWVEGIQDAETLTQAMQNHISEVVGRYKGQIFAWDVCNEIFEEDGSFRSSVFYDLLGEDFVSLAFNMAREADPDAKLFINDYNLDSADSAKTQAMASNVQKWISEGVPIDGIGSQSHLSPGMGAANAGALAALAASGVEQVAITELDIAQAPADDYLAVMNGCLDVESCVGITVWGVSDKDSWRQGEDPLLFDGSFQPKPAYDALVQALQ